MTSTLIIIAYLFGAAGFVLAPPIDGVKIARVEALIWPLLFVFCAGLWTAKTLQQAGNRWLAVSLFAKRGL